MCTYTHPSTSTHPLYTLFSWTSLTWLTVDAADAVGMVHAVLVQVLVNAEPWKLFGFSYSFHFWCVWGIFSISLEQVALWGQSLRLQWDVFSWLCCRLKRYKTWLQVRYLTTDSHADQCLETTVSQILLCDRYTSVGTVACGPSPLLSGQSLYWGDNCQESLAILAAFRSINLFWIITPLEILINLDLSNY